MCVCMCVCVYVGIEFFRLSFFSIYEDDQVAFLFKSTNIWNSRARLSNVNVLLALWNKPYMFVI